MNTEETVVYVLSTLKDPFLNLTGKEMNLQCSMELVDNQMLITLTSGFPCEILKEHYQPLLHSVLQKYFPGYRLIIDLKHRIQPHKTQLIGKGLRGVKNTIAIASGKGGVGKSTVTANLATALARFGARVGILDADIYGPSMPLMLGDGTQPLQTSGSHYLPVQAHGVQIMSIGYLSPNDNALIWRGPMLAKSLIQMLDITLWNDLDYLLIDLPPGTGDIQLTLVQKIPLTSAIIITTPQNVATIDAQKAINMFSKTNIDVLGIIENMSTHICSSCGHQEAIFGTGGAENLCKIHQIRFLGQLPLDTQIRIHCDEGQPTATKARTTLTDTFIKIAMQSIIELSKKPINYADKFPRIVVE